MKLKGYLLDLDGVVTHTESLHLKAWEKCLNGFLQHLGGGIRPFQVPEDYLLYVDGRPRKEGIRAFFASRELEIKEEEVQTISEKKNQEYLKALKREGPVVFEDSVRFLRDLKRQGGRLALVSSSKNAKLVLAMAHISDLFEVVVDGQVGQERKLRGKPYPDYFREAARCLKLPLEECLAVEDALAGVKAAKAAGAGKVYGLIHGQDQYRGADKKMQELLLHGADAVVSSLWELPRGE